VQVSGSGSAAVVDFAGTLTFPAGSASQTPAADRDHRDTIGGARGRQLAGRSGDAVRCRDRRRPGPGRGQRARMAVSGSRSAHRRTGCRPAFPYDPAGQNRTDGPGGAPRAQERRHRPARARFGAVRRRIGAHRQHPEGVGGHGRRLPAPGVGHSSADPADLRGGRCARAQQRGGRDAVPPQHRVGRRA
jgi:hypothetical protein